MLPIITISSYKLIDLQSTSQKKYKSPFWPPKNSVPGHQARIDSEEVYEHNLKSKPADWIWRNKVISYVVNDQYYRCDNFSNIDWNNSIVMLGCSHVFGQGVDDKDTLSAQLSTLLNYPVINLGVMGACQNFAIYNMVNLFKAGHTPRAIVFVWPEYLRALSVDIDNQIRRNGIWNNYGMEDAEPFTKQNINTRPFHSKYNQQIVELLCAGKNIPLIQVTLDPPLARAQGITLLEKIDSCRSDDLHGGPETYRKGAEVIKDLVHRERVELPTFAV